ncbi:MAG: phosphoglycerate kinase [Candidatus Edwardsbacteria bacterium RIFOXYD12_FULL_50_11]|uniref:Phosphoglycerate kinase n=1 Tax=Candidatus Edwardsbacteria bacterium GWF2_54_11 TaxID=1817851 RepID=A0A1F5RIP7_9BACT|nr:MAG: phosphoglycerate kinase [Candidatus Edwardsbacteria bacterium RifOxyC12_full_54_24]OGF06986.1 MAG: phosphoglycerate kinase [Candidatus Edwardsbacteria bacterium RifOxyA12_full_54_48]OGF11048.1 MAG: phosphoglycerate kinase [Candidatus Edwardsbacteria bacterium GWE2_54_12]OGF14053.1 MAG: phosphoglycerate kinase [Candidatus Edwardsbacteria bacterium GWF2_54_11]OGF15994.1 MAG: phosphoglycerate kinase [Candidatus Edwardsbacteria bacterium RIFOXYD12_FULL_50_11]OGJ17543.1 MAG: phosphoglycerat
MKKLNIRDLDLKGKRVLVRVDFNVPQDKKTGAIKDDSRVVGALPTINYLIEHGAKVILMSHLGRPDGQVNVQFTLKPVAEKLSELLKKPIKFASDCIGLEPLKISQELKAGEVLLLENLRFHAEEEKNDPAFAKQLAELGEIYVNDAFGTAHRAHASTEGVTKYFKQNAAGFLMEKEIDYLSAVLESPEHPFVAILGGAKVSDKIAVIENLLNKADAVLIGGAMAYTFLLAQGKEVGSSLVEKDKLNMAKDILQKSQKIRFLLPIDHIAAEKKEGQPDKKGKPTFTFVNPKEVAEIPRGLAGVDIGPRTIIEYNKAISGARTIVWNGPMGIFETPEYAKGTFEVAKAVAASGAKSIIGGGDSASAVHLSGVAEKISHISTGGGASLEFLEGKVLPGVAALTDK